MPYYVYVLTNNKGTLYTGVTNNLERRMYEHKHGLVDGFTRKYKVARLLHYEGSDDVRSAIGREKEIKRWRREKKLALIESANPSWVDLSEGWYGSR